MSLKNYPNDDVKQFGERVASALMNASIQHSMGGLGGCKVFTLHNFDTDTHPYVLEYLKGNNDSAAIIYTAMKTKELETL